MISTKEEQLLKQDRAYIDRMERLHSKMYNPIMSIDAKAACYENTWPSHKCEKCRYMWDCIHASEQIKEAE